MKTVRDIKKVMRSEPTLEGAGVSPDVKGEVELRQVVYMAVALAVLAAAAMYLLFRGPGARVEFEKAAPPASKAADARPVLRVAVAAMISPEATRRYYGDLLGLMADKVGRRVVFLQRRTYAEVNALIEKKEVDLAFVCSGPYVRGHDRFGLEILAVPVSHGSKVYYSYIIVPKGSPANSLGDLKGKRFAFTDPDSNTGCLVPRYMLAKRGATPASFFKETFYTHSHDNSIRAVAEGQADGAAVDSLIFDFLASTGSAETARVRVVEKSPPYGIPPVVAHPALDPDLKARLRETLLSLHEDPEARRLLGLLQVDRFEPGDDGMYGSVREMDRWLSKADNKP